MTMLATRVECGYCTTDVAEATGLSYRQLHYWTQAGLIEPSLRFATGTGNRWRWSDADIEFLQSVAARIAWGMSPARALDPDTTPPPPLVLPDDSPAGDHPCP